MAIEWAWHHQAQLHHETSVLGCQGMIPGNRVSRLSYDELLFVPTPHPLYWGIWDQPATGMNVTALTCSQVIKEVGASILNFKSLQQKCVVATLPFTSAHAKETYDGNLNESGLGASAPAHAGGMLS